MSSTKDFQEAFAETEYFSEAHQELDEFVKSFDLPVFTTYHMDLLVRLQAQLGAYHERYGRRLTAQEESWLKEYDAIHPREVVGYDDVEEETEE
tara:strand:+ start:502 stop:783 length:282 start_codon:yes stop_codon:yes gene_type:complete